MAPAGIICAACVAGTITMRYESVADIYSANRKFRERMLALVNSISEDEAHAFTDGEPWSASHLLEHVATVNGGMAGICRKLIEKAKESGAVSDGTLAISPDFFQRAGAPGTEKLEAPERVRPGGGVPIAESLERMAAADAAFEEMRGDFETVGLMEPKFPHPYFGGMTAVEWFVLMGLHENRHAGQLENLLSKIRK